MPVEIARELCQSVLWHRLLITGDPITDDLVIQLVDDVLIPLTQAPTTAGSWRSLTLERCSAGSSTCSPNRVCAPSD